MLGLVQLRDSCAPILALILVVVGAVDGAPLAAQEEPTPEEQLAQAQRSLAEQREAVSEIESRLTDDPRNAALWEGLITQRSLLSAFERAVQGMTTGAELPPPTPEEIRQQQEAWIGEWIAAVPDDPRPLVYRARVLNAEQPEARAEALREVAARFTDDFETQRIWAEDLKYRGAGAEALALMTAYLESHSTSEAFEWVYSYTSEAAPAKANEVLDRWIARLPDDPGALQVWYRRESEGLSPEQRRALAADLAPRLPPRDAAGMCGGMYDSMRGSGLEDAIACYQRVFPRLDRSSTDYNETVMSYAAMVGGAGDMVRFQEAARLLPEHERQLAARNVAHSMFYRNQCDQGVALIRASGTRIDDAVAMIAGDPRREPRCARTESMRSLVEDAIATADLSILGLVVRGYSPYMPAEPIEAVLLRRLAASPKETILYQSLDDLYRGGAFRGGTSGEPGIDPAQKRIALLERWMRVEPANTAAAEKLSDALFMAGNTERALAVLEAVAGDESNAARYDLQERLAGHYAMAGRFEEAEAVGQRMIATGEPYGYQGHLLLAQLALAREDMPKALGHYERFFEAAEPGDWARAGEYKYVLASLDDGERLVGFLEGLWEKSLAKGVHPGGTREEWIAAQLQEAGAVEEALRYYERRMAAGGLTPETLRQIADLSEVAERWDLAERVRVQWRDLASTEAEGWAQLAEYYLRRSDGQRALGVLDQAFERVEIPGPKLWILWAEALLGDAERREAVPLEDLVEAIKVLEQAKGTFPDNPWWRDAVDEKLKELYTLLGQRDLAKAKP